MVIGQRALPVFLVLFASLLPACGDRSPSSNTPPSTTPATQPPATQPPAPVSTCARLGLGPGAGRNCPRERPSFLKQVDDAINLLTRQHPEIFNFSDERGSGGYRVLSRGQFYVGLIATLEAMGLCADFDSAELQVKSSNAFNDQYAVMISSDHIRRGDSSYRSTCAPAAFPTPMPPFPDSNGCPLPGSLEKACGREQPNFLADVEAAIDQLYKEHPELFDFSKGLPGTGWPKLVNQEGYIVLMIQKMMAKGYCARYDGAELVVKKENRLSDQYDIVHGDGFVRRGAGSYRATCYPAAF